MASMASGSGVKDIATVIGDSLFMHAGLNPSRPAPKSIDEVNDRVRDEVRRLDAHRKRLADGRLGLSFFGLQEVINVSIFELQLATQAIAAAKGTVTAPPSLGTSDTTGITEPSGNQQVEPPRHRGPALVPRVCDVGRGRH